VNSFINDVRFAFRSLTQSRGFTTVAVAMVALGIGANAAVFTVTKAVLFKGSRSIDRNDRILYVGSGGPCCVSYPDFDDWRAQAKSFDGMGAVADLRITLSDRRGVAETNSATQVTAETFRLIGQRPAIGRDFLPSDALRGAVPVTILSYGFWERRYGKDPAIVGETVRMNGVATTVIGVMPPGFAFPQKQDVWVPLVPTPDFQQREARRLWFAFGRMADGVTVEAARAEMDIIGRRLAREYPSTNQRFLPVVMTFQQFYVGPNATTTYALMWCAVGFVLLIACANLANLLLARGMGRSREISVRMALGAGRCRIVRQLLVESVMLSVVGGIAGWWIAKAAVQAYELASAAPTLYWSDQLFDYSLDYGVLVYVMAISVSTGLLFGLAPALRLSKLDISSSLKEGKSGGTRSRHLSALLVVGETALAVVLLAAAGVMIRSFLNVYTAQIGVNPSNILTMFLDLPAAKYPTAASQTAFFDQLTTRMSALPGVESVSFAWRPPTSGSLRLPFELAGAPVVDSERRSTLSSLVVSPAYFRTLGATVVSGRDFTDSDAASGMPVAIVNQQFASTNWPGEDPLGRRLRVFDAETPGPWLTVVGVVSNITQNSTRQSADSLVYLPYRQRATSGMWVFARTRVRPATLGAAFRRELQAIDPDLPIWLGPFTLTERLSAVYWNRGLYGGLFLVFAAIALMLAALGLYSVVAHSVSQRTREIGVRMAMGATPRDVLALVVAQGMVPVTIGLAIGVATSSVFNRLLRAELVQVSPADPFALVMASAALVVAAVLGCCLPARRAARVDPLVALKYE
jgi:predicted permease